MLTFSLSTVTSFILIVLIGLLTWFSDRKHRKIKNDHLIVVACVSIVMIVISGCLGDITFISTRILSVFCAIIISWIFYIHNLWRGGDAKLFTLYATLMPPTGYEPTLFVPAIVLFVNSFIIALIYVCFSIILGAFSRPSVLKENRFKQWKNESLRSVVLKILKLRVWKEFVRATWITLCLAWLLFPVFDIMDIATSLSFLIIYFIKLLVFRRLEEFNRNGYLISSVLILGLVIRAIYFQDILSGINLLQFLKTVITFSAMSLALYNITKGIQKSETRVAFAPFLFLGCLVSYTPFLSFLMSLQKVMRF